MKDLSSLLKNKKIVLDKKEKNSTDINRVFFEDILPSINLPASSINRLYTNDSRLIVVTSNKSYAMVIFSRNLDILEKIKTIDKSINKIVVI